MRYIIIDKKTGEIVGNLGGYTTKRGALEGRLSYPMGNVAWHYVHDVLKCQPGEKFRNNLYQYAEDHYDIIEISDISWKSTSGNVYTKKL